MFGEKTLPTSLFFAMLAWQMNHPRGTADLRAKSFHVFNQMVGLCTKTGKFSVHVHHYTGALHGVNTYLFCLSDLTVWNFK